MNRIFQARKQQLFGRDDHRDKSNAIEALFWTNW